MSYYAGDYDIAVIGAGHAGCEAGLAAARLGMKTLVFSISLEAVANMPCNPHIGGSSKGHLVREIDALGGEMGKNIDKTMIQIKMLNTSKGPAVHSLRAQADRKRYHMEMKHTLEKQENLYLKQGEIVDIKVENGKVTAVETSVGAIYGVKAVIVATGTKLSWTALLVFIPVIYVFVFSLGMGLMLSALVVAIFLAVPYWKAKYFSKPTKRGGNN